MNWLKRNKHVEQTPFHTPTMSDREMMVLTAFTGATLPEKKRLALLLLTSLDVAMAEEIVRTVDRALWAKRLP
jgi:hypothetical protein